MTTQEQYKPPQGQQGEDKAKEQERMRKEQDEERRKREEKTGQVRTAGPKDE